VNGPLAESETFQSSWTPALPPEAAARAMEVSHGVAARLSDHHRVQLAAVTAPTQTAFPRTVHWQPTSLAQGDAGMALICGCLDACFPDQEWDRIGHVYLTAAAQGAEQAPFLSSGMFSGLAGVAFSALSLSRGGSRYWRLLTVLNDALLPQIAGQAHNLKRQAMDGLSFGDFE
jgi:lantibiotic biosynthesis protein